MRAMNPEIIPPPISLDKPSLIEHEAEEVLLKSEKQAAFSNPQSWLKTGVVGGIAGILGAALFITLGHILHPLFLTKSPSTPSFSAQFQENIKPIEGQVKGLDERITTLANTPSIPAPSPSPAQLSVLETRLSAIENKELPASQPMPIAPISPPKEVQHATRLALALSLTLAQIEAKLAQGQCSPDNIKRLAALGIPSDEITRLSETCARATVLGLNPAQLSASVEKDINAFYAAPIAKSVTPSEPTKGFWDRFITIRRVENTPPLASSLTPSPQAAPFAPFLQALKRGDAIHALSLWEDLPRTTRDPLMVNASLRTMFESLNAYAQTQEQFARLQRQALDTLMKEESSP
jgi:hypothetical protein